MELEVDEYRIIIHSQPLQILEKFTQVAAKTPESGGIIIGKIINDQINIVKLSVPTSLDRCSRTNFERHKVSAQIVIDYEYYNSNGQLIYLGEWHTHPESYPAPSKQDLFMISSQFENNFLNTNFLLLLIKGTKGLYLRIIDKDKYYEKTISLL